MSDITIMVGGEIKSGKTTVAYLIAKALYQEGFKVNVVDDSNATLVMTTLSDRTTAIINKQINIVTKNYSTKEVKEALV